MYKNTFVKGFSQRFSPATQHIIPHLDFRSSIVYNQVNHTQKRCKMKKIMFVCHGNICRSPMAEFIFKKLIRERGLESEFYVASSATSREELGNPVYPPARAELARHGIDATGKYAVQMTRSDYDKYDLLIPMDSMNVRNMMKIIGSDPEGKVKKLMDYTSRGGDVADPWFTGEFGITYRDIYEGCSCLLDELTK